LKNAPRKARYAPSFNGDKGNIPLRTSSGDSQYGGAQRRKRSPRNRIGLNTQSGGPSDEEYRDNYE